MEEQPNYYAVIPAEIRYCKEITANAKLLYGEISALCNKDGYCWASNSYFSKLYGVSNASISRWIKELEKQGFIKSEIIRNENKEIISRNIFINTLYTEMYIPYPQNCKYPIDKNVKENNPSINNPRINNIRRFQKPTVEEIAAYIKEKGYSVDAESFFDYYESVGWKRGKTPMKDWKATVRTWNKKNKKGNDDDYTSEYANLF